MLKLTIKTLEQRQRRCSNVFVVNFEHISQLFLGLLLSLNGEMLAGQYFMNMPNMFNVKNKHPK